MTSKEVLVGQSAPSAHLVVRGVEKRFGGVHALRGADFEVARGEVMALVGDMSQLEQNTFIAESEQSKPLAQTRKMVILK